MEIELEEPRCLSDLLNHGNRTSFHKITIGLSKDEVAVARTRYYVLKLKTRFLDDHADADMELRANLYAHI